MSDEQQSIGLPAEAAERDALFAIAESMAIPLMQAMVGADPRALTNALVQAIVTQTDYKDVLEGLVDPERQASHPFWGFSIVRQDGQILGNIIVPKILTPSSPKFVSDLAQWLIVYAYVSTPQLRVAWGAVRARVEFFQSRTDGTTAPGPSLKLVMP
jgi:hypothetical protein